MLLYALSLPFQIVTLGSYLVQGSTALTVLTALQAGLIAALFWAFLGNALVATQIVEDGTMASLVVRVVLAIPIVERGLMKFNYLATAVLRFRAHHLHRHHIRFARHRVFVDLGVYSIK